MKTRSQIMFSCTAVLLLQLIFIAGNLTLNVGLLPATYLSQSSEEFNFSQEWSLDTTHPMRVSDCENRVRTTNERSFGSDWLSLLIHNIIVSQEYLLLISGQQIAGQAYQQAAPFFILFRNIRL